jgi:hypothetical protein
MPSFSTGIVAVIRPGLSHPQLADSSPATGARSVIRKQLIVLLGATAGFVVVGLVWQHAAQLFARIGLPADDPASRLAYVAHWLILPGLTLLAGIIAAGRRGFIADAIDGTRTPANHGLEINLRYNENTLEQTVLAEIASYVWLLQHAWPAQGS